MASMGDIGEEQLMTGEAVALDVRPSGFILRSAGAIIDFIAYIGLFLGLIMMIAFAGGFRTNQALAAALVTSSLAFSIVVAPVVVELATRGRSLGKLAIGARIVRDDGGAIQFRQAFIRALTGVVEIFMTFGGLAALCALLNGRSKRLGDLLAGTYSQHERVPAAADAGFAVPPALATWAQTADAAKLPDRLARRIAAYVAQASAMNSTSRARLATELANEASAYVWPLPEVAPEVFLAAVAAIRRDRDYQALLLERERLNRLAPVLTGLPHFFPDR